MGEDALIAKRIDKISQLRARGVSPYSNNFRVDIGTKQIRDRFDSLSADELASLNEEFALAGRIITRRDFGKATFFHLKDGSGMLQAYISRDTVSEDTYFLLKKLDIGDIVGIKGRPFRTRTGELTIEVHSLTLLTKALRSLPEKWHGLTDIEIRHRQRYLDLLANPEVKEVFVKRARMVEFIRRFLTARGFLEVETPMMQDIPGGAAARPFKTYHNALGIELFLRIAPELYLKRLLVGGMDRVFEINRSFRNEGISSEHNPEFTMLEFYMAYADYHDLMSLTEEMFSSLALEIFSRAGISFQGNEIDLTPPWQRLSLRQALIDKGGVAERILDDPGQLIQMCQELGVPLEPGEGAGKALTTLFEKLVEEKLIQPTFVIDYPVEVSPLAKRSEKDPEVVERFELFIAGKEIGNAFSELTDPLDQRERFVEQARKRPAEEAVSVDEDFLAALEYGMPPAAGEGIGIDRLVMLFTDSPSIREVVLFPQLRPVRGK
ncbi:MAG: lysine--tRNA ligase [Thermodesulfobacteriota bacterium]